MTAVEFLDRTPIENIISSLTTIPDKIIFIGESKYLKKFELVNSFFLKNRGLNIKTENRNIIRNNINNIVEVLSEIVETEDQCIFDLTGGDDLVLVAMGIVFQKYPEKNIQMQRFNIKNGVVTDCDNDGNIIYTGEPLITVEENIRLHGGVIRYEPEKENGTFQWDLSDDFIRDIEKIWEISRSDPGYWNTRSKVLEAFEIFSDKEQPLSVSADLSVIKEHLKHNNKKYVSVSALLRVLEKKKLIFSYSECDDKISFIYKNEQVKKCLIKAGTVLELKVLLSAQNLTDKNGTAFYSDTMSGVYIDWDGMAHNEDDTEKDTGNEIDVILMKGLMPIFISCKNGQVDDDELYKLETVANRFGGSHVKKFLIATYLGKKEKSMEYFRQRATDMDITLIDGVHLMNDAEFNKTIKNLINK